MARRKKDLFELRQEFREQFMKGCKGYLHALVRSPKKHNNFPLESRCDQRRRFLRACFFIEPEMGRILHDELKPLCPSELFQQAPDYFRALNEWLDRFNLNYDWVRASIDATLRNWDRFDRNTDEVTRENDREGIYVPLIIRSGDVPRGMAANVLFMFACPWNIATNGIDVIAPHVLPVFGPESPQEIL